MKQQKKIQNRQYRKAAELKWDKWGGQVRIRQGPIQRGKLGRVKGAWIPALVWIEHSQVPTPSWWYRQGAGG